MARTWGKATTFPLIVYFVPLHKAHIQMTFLSRDSQMEIPKFPKLGLPWLWGPITFCANFWLRWGLKQSHSPCWDLFNGMSHTTYTQGNRVDSQLLMIKSQIADLTLGPSFGHNSYFKCPNGSWELILDIYVSIDLQWYKKLFNLLGFDPCNYSINIQESTGTPTPKVEAPLGVWGFIPHTFFHSRASSLGPQPWKPLPWLRPQG
jgi:hypothetical protein